MMVNIVLLSCVLSSPWIRRFVMGFLSLGATGMYVIVPADISKFVMVSLGPWQRYIFIRSTLTYQEYVYNSYGLSNITIL